MLNSFFQGVFDTELTTVIAPADFLLCVGVSLLIGLLLCAMTMWRAKSSGSFVITLALLPAVVCVVIMMVNGNVGTGVAVAGAFSLIRFRFRPGNRRYFYCHGNGTHRRYGVFGLCSTVCPNFRRRHHALYRCSSWGRCTK